MFDFCAITSMKVLLGGVYMYINTNISALNSLSKLGSNQSSSSKIMEGLASGKRINRASDDAAGTAVSSRMTTQVRGMDQASRNASDGIAALQTFEGAMSTQADILQRMRELAVQASNGTYSSGDRDNLDAEYQQLATEFDRIATNTSFNGNKFIATTGQTLDLQLSDVANDTLTIAFSQGTLTGVGMTLGDLTGADGTKAQVEIAALDGAIDAVSKNRADLGSYMNRLEYTVDNLSNAKVNISDAKSRIEDLDMASAMSELTKNEILTQSSVSMLARANQAPQAILKLIG